MPIKWSASLIPNISKRSSFRSWGPACMATALACFRLQCPAWFSLILLSSPHSFPFPLRLRFDVPLPCFMVIRPGLFCEVKIAPWEDQVVYTRRIFTGLDFSGSFYSLFETFSLGRAFRRNREPLGQSRKPWRSYKHSLNRQATPGGYLLAGFTFQEMPLNFEWKGLLTLESFFKLMDQWSCISS